MRLACLLLMELIPLSIFCQTSRNDPAAEKHSYHTLAKYTYLVWGLKKNERLSRMDPVTFSSGFFIRSNDRLFFVSAYHVFTGCAILWGAVRPDRADSLEIWYMDTTKHYKSQRLSVEGYKKKPCPKDVIADVDTMDVSAYFKDGKIYSIEHMIPDYYHDYRFPSTGDRLVGYGFAHQSYSSKIERRRPGKYICRIVDIPEKAKPDTNEQMKIAYIAVKPALDSGCSGAPIFRVDFDARHRKRFEFAGIQSMNNDTFKLSFVVNSIELQKKIPQSKENRSTSVTLRR